MSKKKFRVNLLIAEIPFQVIFLGADNNLQKKITGYYENFTIPSRDFRKNLDIVNIEINFLIRKPKKTASRPRLPYCKNEIFIWEHKGKFQGKVDLKKRKAKFFCLNSMFYINRILRVTCSLHIIQNNGLLLHASSILRNDSGYVFFGHQNAGKSTIIKLLDGEVLSDDTTILRPIEKKFFIFSSPFDPKIQNVRNFKVELKTLFLLGKSKFDKISLVTNNSFLLIYNHTRPNLKFIKNCDNLKSRTFQNISLLIEKKSIYSLRFKKGLNVRKVVNEFDAKHQS